jgi:hypothetical protein
MNFADAHALSRERFRELISGSFSDCGCAFTVEVDLLFMSVSDLVMYPAYDRCRISQQSGQFAAFIMPLGLAHISRIPWL